MLACELSHQLYFGSLAFEDAVDLPVTGLVGVGRPAQGASASTLNGTPTKDMLEEEERELDSARFLPMYARTLFIFAFRLGEGLLRL